jgi:hypothetical protein
MTKKNSLQFSAAMGDLVHGMDRIRLGRRTMDAVNSLWWDVIITHYDDHLTRSQIKALWASRVAIINTWAQMELIKFNPTHESWEWADDSIFTTRPDHKGLFYV